MKPTALLAVLLLALLSLGPLHAQAERSPALESMPEVLMTQSEGRTFPRWVAAERVLDPSGEIDSSLFSADQRESLSRIMKLPEKQGCIALAGEIVDHLDPPVRENVFQAAKYARFVMIAEVTGVKGGFRGTEAGSLVQVIPAEVLKSDGRETRKPFYLFLPNGFFSVGPHRFCARNASYPSLPEIGDQVMVFIPSRFDTSSPLLDIFDDGGVVVLKKDSSVDLPLRYRTDGTIKGLGKDAFVKNVRGFITLGERK